MSALNLYGVTGKLATSIDSDTAILLVTPDLSGALEAAGLNDGNETWLALQSGNVYEVVRAYAVSGTAVTVERSDEAHPFATGTQINFVLTAEALLEQIGTPPEGVTLQGEGLVQVDTLGPNFYSIRVDYPNFVGANGIAITGSYPDYEISYTPPDNECCGDGSGSGTAEGVTEVNATGVVNASISGHTLFIDVPELNLEAGAGINISGAWPNFTITNTAAGGGSVTSVTAGVGLSLTGTPSINPTLFIANTGVVAGTYGGVAINSRGQLTAVPTTFNPVSIVNGSGAATVNRVADAVTIGVRDAEIGVTGVVALADPDSDFDPDDETSAASPAVVAKALETLIMPAATGASSYTAETSGLYTTPMGATATALLLASGETALVRCGVTMVDGTTPDDPVSFGIAVFDSTPTIVKGNRKIKQSSQTMEFILSGPINTTLVMATTDVPASASVQSYFITVQKM